MKKIKILLTLLLWGNILCASENKKQPDPQREKSISFLQRLAYNLHPNRKPPFLSFVQNYPELLFYDGWRGKKVALFN